jgi:enoyl-CoA hydratase
MRTNVVTSVEQHVAWITINRPEQLNALNAETLQDLTAAVRTAGDDETVRVVVITGAGEKAFIAGADIKAMAQMDVAGAQEFGQIGHACMNTIASTPKPVIAMVNGFALGGGCEVALACDFIYASENAVFGLPEVTLGLFPGFGGTQRLLGLVEKAKAMELIFTGRKLTAQEACEWGVVNRVVAQPELRATVEQLAKTIAANSPTAIRVAKHLMVTGEDLSLTDGLLNELKEFPTCFSSVDRTEGLQAFLERRKPAFTGK